MIFKDITLKKSVHTSRPIQYIYMCICVCLYVLYMIEGEQILVRGLYYMQCNASDVKEEDVDFITHHSTLTEDRDNYMQIYRYIDVQR